MKLDKQKHLFRLEEDIHYFNHASKAPLLQSAEQAVLDALEHNRNPYDFSPPHYFKKTNSVRKMYGQLINCRPSQIALIPSVSYGMATALKNIPYKKGQHAVIFHQEFPSDYFSAKRWCDSHQAALRTIHFNPDVAPFGADWNEQVLSQINEDTAFVIACNVHWMNGVKFDLKAIGARCKATDTRLLVDGTQSVGALKMDVQDYHIDALICGSYKWLFGPYGLGLAYFSEYFNEGVPLEEAWMNRTNTDNFSTLCDYEPNYKAGAQRYNVGETSNFLQMPYLEKGLEQVLEWTPERIQDYTGDLLSILLDFLDEKGIVYESATHRANHLFGMRLPSVDVDQLRLALAEHKIYLSVRGDALRIALHLYNTEEDIKQLIKVLRQFL